MIGSTLRLVVMGENRISMLRSIAARKMEEAWRHKNMVPSCPHCHNGLFPEDFKTGMSMLGKDYARGLLAQKVPQK